MATKILTARVKQITTKQGTTGYQVRDNQGERYGLYRSRIEAEAMRLRIQWSLDREMRGEYHMLSPQPSS